jgi:spoIIIJ-associated protein
MPIADKVAAAKQIDALLKDILSLGGFKLKYRITVNPPFSPDAMMERPDILVELAGPDSSLVLERGGEMLRALEHLAIKMLRLEQDEHEKISFDCRNYKSDRLRELRMGAEVAAERVRTTGVPYAFAPMTSRERRILHLQFRDHDSLRTESQGEAAQRHVVLVPKDYKGAVSAPAVFSRRRR